jgi:thiol-disulfide isomerase/thioredoxin
MKKIRSHADFDALRADPLAIVVAKGRTCPACIPVAARIDEIAARHPAATVYEVMIDDVPRFRGEWLIFTVPTVIILEYGKEVLRQSRYFDDERIEALLAYAESADRRKDSGRT